MEELIKELEKVVNIREKQLIRLSKYLPKELVKIDRKIISGYREVIDFYKEEE